MKYCSKCGESNNDEARYCTKCGHQIDRVDNPAVGSNLPDEEMPVTYLWQSIVVTVLCCIPFGIPAIINAAQVSKRYQRGDSTGARRSSRIARNFCIWGGIIGLVWYVIWVIYYSVIFSALGLTDFFTM